MDDSLKRDKAWVGDAVLALYARQWILRQTNIGPKNRTEEFVQLTSNQFLSSFGEPTSVEAEIGCIYEQEGLQAAFQHIESEFVPIFLKQRAKRKRPGSYRKKRST